MKYLTEVIFLALIPCMLSEECVKIPARNCDCRTSKYHISLEAYMNTPFLNQRDKNHPGVFYSYSPCTGITRPSECPPEATAGYDTLAVPKATEKAAVWERSKGKCAITGDMTEPKFGGDPEDDELYIEYTADSGRVTTHVKLLCSSSTELVVVGETTLNVHELTLYTPEVCIKKGLSIGSILLIVFFVLVLVYIVCGMLYLRFKHGARGTEMIPNYDFWAELPDLIKEGVLFVWKGCKKVPTYQQI